MSEDKGSSATFGKIAIVTLTSRMRPWRAQLKALILKVHISTSCMKQANRWKLVDNVKADIALSYQLLRNLMCDLVCFCLGQRLDSTYMFDNNHDISHYLSNNIINYSCEISYISPYKLKEQLFSFKHIGYCTPRKKSFKLYSTFRHAIHIRHVVGPFRPYAASTMGSYLTTGPLLPSLPPLDPRRKRRRKANQRFKSLSLSRSQSLNLPINRDLFAPAEGLYIS